MTELNLIKPSEINPDLSNLEIKSYLPFSIKQALIINILETSIVETTRIKRFDYATLEMIKELTLANQYSNIDLLDEDVIEAYDMLKEKGVIDTILQNISPSEIAFFNTVLDKEIAQVTKLDNSIESIISDALNTLLAKIPDEKGMAKLLREIPKQLNKITPDKLSVLTEAMGLGFNKEE